MPNEWDIHMRTVVQLSPNQLSLEDVQRHLDSPLSHNVVQDLMAFTGMTEARIWRYLTREASSHFESEFNWVAPRTREELSMFYRGSVGYLWANALHLAHPLTAKAGGRVLDYGAGVGSNTMPLLECDEAVHFVEIGTIQAQFIRFRAERRNMPVLEVPPFYMYFFDPIKCVTSEYDTIMCFDVLEHIPDYHLTVQHLVRHLAPGGLFLENTPFDYNARPIAIHLRPSMPLAEAMGPNMTLIEPGVWQHG